MAQRYDNKVTIIGVGSLDSEAKIAAFVDRYGLGVIPNVIDEDGSVRSRLGVVGQPNWVFVSTDGSQDKLFGEIDDDELTRRLDALLG